MMPIEGVILEADISGLGVFIAVLLQSAPREPIKKDLARARKVLIGPFGTRWTGPFGRLDDPAAEDLLPLL